MRQNCRGWGGEGVADLPRARQSEPMEHRRAQKLRRKTRHSGRSGKRRMCEERAQGNGVTTVRVMRQRTRARRGGGIPPTKYRAADGGCSAREESRFSPKGETNACAVCPVPEGALRGHGRGRSRADRSRGWRVVQDSPPTAYMYTPSGAKDAQIARPAQGARLPRP